MKLKYLLYLLSFALLAGCIEEQEPKQSPNAGNAGSGSEILVVVDQQNVAFKGLKFYLNGDDVVSRTTDDAGVYILAASETGWKLGGVWWYWPIQSSGNDFIGNFENKVSSNGETRYKISRVLHFDGAGAALNDRNVNRNCTVGNAGCFASNTRYIAEAFLAPTSMDVCHIGMGVFSQTPATIGIRTHAGGLPGSDLGSASVLLDSKGNLADRPNLGAAASANLCEGGHASVHLVQGVRYWIVSTYTANLGSGTSLVNYQGSTLSPAAGVSMQESADGTNWTIVPTLSNGGFSSILIFVAQ